MSEAEQGRGQAGVEGDDALGAVHLARGVEGGSVVPRGACAVGGGAGDLGHEAGFDDPDGVGRQCAAAPGHEGGVDFGEPFATSVLVVTAIFEMLARAVVYGHVDRPSGQITQEHGSQAAIKPHQAVLSEDGLCRAQKPFIQHRRGGVRAGVEVIAEGALGLELGLDHV